MKASCKMSATALTSSILSQHSLITWHKDIKFWRKKHLAGVASKSYTSRRRATRRVEEVCTTRRRGTHDASKRYARRVEEVCTTRRKATRRVCTTCRKDTQLSRTRCRIAKLRRTREVTTWSSTWRIELFVHELTPYSTN